MPREGLQAELYPLLKDVSRSFYKTLRVLPGKVRPQIGLAYLLARMTDTIADTGIVASEKRLEALQAFRERISGANETPLELGALARQQGSPAERLLLEKCEESLGLLKRTEPFDRKLIQEVLAVITSGQELDLRRFANASAGKLTALGTDEELDDYTYRVAGCVGEFWTRMCRARLFPNARLDDSTLLTQAVRFGKGLQLVNVLRDLPKDLREGRCYVPSEALAAHGLEPAVLLDAVNEGRVRPFYDTYLDRAEEHLRVGWVYTNSLPRRSVRVRLACAWPILIGLETIRLLRTRNFLDAAKRIKVSRAEVGRIIRRTVLFYPWASFWRRLAE
jgi:farnesyl-diphosphate farnesyltransferase